MALTRFRSVHILLGILACSGWLAQSAAACYPRTDGQTISVLLCGGGPGRYMQMRLGVPEHDPREQECCGDCLAAPPGLTAQAPELTLRSIQWQPLEPICQTEPLCLATPLWPGAPPHGPPA